MVTMLAARWQLGARLYRETRDVDLGVPPMVAREYGVVARLKGLGYTQVAGNRFARSLSDIPAGIERENEALTPETFIDVLVPAYTSRARPSVAIAENLFATEVPGLPVALNRPPVTLVLELHRLNGETLPAVLPFPDEVSALVLKGLATRVRFKDTDVADIWRCLEIAVAAGLGPADFSGSTRAEGADQVRALFSNRRGTGMRALITEQRLSNEAADERFTRIRALIQHALGSG